MNTPARLRLFLAARLFAASISLPLVAVAQPQLLMHLELDENPATNGTALLDASGNGNHATVINNNPGVSKSVPGVHGRALRFDGNGDRVDSTAFDLDDTFTIALWVNPTAGNRQTFVGKHDSNGGNQLVLGFFNGYHLRIRGDAYQLGTLQTGWQHIAVVGEATGTNQTKVTFYRNAVPLWTRTLNARIGNVAGGLGWTLGQEWDPGPGGPVTSDHLSGDIDDVKIWNGALIAQEIENEFSGGIITPPDEPPAGFELPFPVELLHEEAAMSDPPIRYFEEPNDAAISGDVAVSTSLSSVHFNLRQDEGWRYQGTLNSLNFSDSLFHSPTVTLAGETLAIGVNGEASVSVHLYERSDGPGFNAWHVWDASSSAPPIHYTADLTPAQQAAAAANGWRYRIKSRFIQIPYSINSASTGFIFGDGTRRYGVLFERDSEGRLRARLPGASPTQHILTPDKTGAEDYHAHELVFNPATQSVTYFLNDNAIHTWQGQVHAQAGVFWGAFSVSDQGSMNVREARFEILQSGELAAHYFAGAAGDPEIAPDPAESGWTASAPPSLGNLNLGYGRPHSPDPATVWELRQVEVFPSETATFVREPGARVAIDGDTMVVGILGDSTSNGTHSGAAHVLERMHDVWVRRATLKPAALGAHDQFGRSVAIDGGTILVGATGRRGASTDTRNGQAFVFTGSGANWTQQAVLTASDGAARDSFGVSVALDGNRAAVGADFKAIGSAGAAGAAYVFERIGLAWPEVARVTATTPAANRQFGCSLDLHGGMFLVGQHRTPTHFLFARGATAAEWNLVDSRIYPVDNNMFAISTVAFDRATDRFLVELMEYGSGGRQTHIYGPDYANADGLADYTRKMLYAPAASASAIPFDSNQAAFRYKHQLYGEDSGTGEIRAQHEIMNNFYGPDERSLALAVVGELHKGLASSPDNPVLGNLLLDIYYDRAAAEAILSKNLVEATERARFGPPLANPPPANGFIIDNEIPLFRDLIAASKTAMVGYFSLLSDDLGLPGDPPHGYTLFRDLVPGRGLMAATYDDGVGAVTVTEDAMLFSGYKDLVLLFELLRDHGRAAHSLARLLVARDVPGDLDEARTLIAESERLLYLQGSMLKSIFPELPGPDDPTGLAQAIAGWGSAIESLANVRQIIAGEANLLGFAPDFLMLIENFTGPGSDIFDSFDVFKERLSLNTLDSTLRRARDRLETARDTFDQFRGYEGQILEQFDQSTISYEFRLFEIVGARPGQANYSDIPNANPGSELDQQFRSIQLARLKIERNRTEIDNLAQEVQIEINRAEEVSAVFIDYGDQQADITETIGHIKAVQAAANALTDIFSAEKILSGANFAALLNGAVQAGAEMGIADLEASKERLAAAEQAKVEGINSAARVKTLFLGMHTLAVDSTEAALLLRQEIARMAALYREKADLEGRIGERNSGLASRYFADPVHRLASDWRMIQATLGFEEAQRWLFFMVRALEFKWNTPFTDFAHDGRTWSVKTLFKLRNADELEAFYHAMNAFDALINRGKTYRFDWFSVREDFMGLKMLDDEGQPAEYIDPVTGETHDAIGMFRANLARSVRPVQGGQEMVVEFNTVRQIPGGFFFVGPTFNLDGSVSSPGRFLNKIDYLQIRLPGDHSLGRSQLAGNLTYGGTSFVRNFNVGHYKPDRPDRLVNEMTAYSTRYWFFDPTPGQQRWKFNEGLTIDAVEMQLSDDPRVPPTVNQIREFKERSVAATGWRLTIPLVQQNTQVMKLDELNDIEIYFHHYSAQRQ